MNKNRDLRGSVKSQSNGVNYLCSLLDQMRILDCPVLGGPVYSYVGRAGSVAPAEYKRQWKTVVKNLKVVTPIRRIARKMVCLEPLNRFETDFINTFDQGLKMIRDVNSPALKLHLDTFHANIEEKYQDEAIRRAGKHLGHNSCLRRGFAELPAMITLIGNESRPALKAVGVSRRHRHRNR
ncbi:MAG: TIM barrel protein [Limisphaerales bacterium]